MKKEVMIVQRIFTHYRKPVFDLLSKKKDLVVVHSYNDSGIKQIKADYSREVCHVKLGKSETSVYLKMLGSLFHYKPGIIIHEFAIGILSLLPVIILAKIMRMKVVLWSHGYDRKKGFHPEKSLADKIRLIYMKLAKAIIVYGENDKKLLSAYVADHKLFVAKNTFDTGLLLELKKRLKETGRESIKKEINFTKKYNLIFIGRLLESKHPELLLDVYEKLSDGIKKDVAFHIIGEGPMFDKISIAINKRGYTDKITLYGAIYDEKLLAKYLYCSDLMIMPGYLGLSVNHAFCFNCPVISFAKGENGPFHSPEADYVEHEKTGFFAKSYDNENMADIISMYLLDSELQARVRKNIEDFMQDDLTVENMVKGIIAAIDYSNS